MKDYGQAASGHETEESEMVSLERLSPQFRYAVNGIISSRKKLYLEEK
jgi:hypothetical protein